MNMNARLSGLDGAVQWATNEWVTAGIRAIEDEARAEIDVETLRERLRIAYITHPDDSHGEVYVNRGIKTALRIIADLVGDLDLYSPCEPDADPRQTADVWCKAHVAFMGSQWSCELAQAPWVWRDARLQEHKR